MDNLALCESKSLREEQLKGLSQDRALETLDKAKALVMAIHHGVGIATTEQVAEYFGVSVETLRQIVKRNKQELESDGLKVLRGKDLKEVSEKMSLTSSASSLAAWTPRSMLRCGMLLRDSEVAKQVRTVLLDIAGQRGSIQYPKQITGDIAANPTAELIERVHTVFDLFFPAIAPELLLGMKIEAACNVDPSLRPMLEPHKPKLLLESPLLSPKAIGEILEERTGGVVHSSQKVNKMLIEKGLQVATGDKKLAYKAIGQGIEFSKIVADTASGHGKTVQSLRWYESVVGLLLNP